MKEVQILDSNFGLSEFIGKEYLTGIPNSINSLVSLMKNLSKATYKGEFYPTIAQHTLKVSRNRHIAPGHRLFAESVSIDGGVSRSFFGEVLSYSPVDGTLTFYVDTITGRGSGYFWNFSFCWRTQTIGFSNTLANGLTGKTTVEGSKEALFIHNLKSPWIYFEDFGYPNGTVLPSSLEQSGTGSGTLQKGFYSCLVPSASKISSVAYGLRGSFCISSVGRLIYETRVVTPAVLSSGTNDYTLFAGLKGEGSTSALPFNVGGLGFYYNYSVNSGNWVGKAANNSSATTVNSSVAIAASTAYTLRISVEAGVVEFFIDGVSVGTTSTIPTAHVNNLMRPFHSITSAAALAAAREFLVDYFYLEVYGD